MLLHVTKLLLNQQVTKQLEQPPLRGGSNATWFQMWYAGYEIQKGDRKIGYYFSFETGEKIPWNGLKTLIHKHISKIWSKVIKLTKKDNNN